MEFRHLGNGRYFPPVAPNGRVYATPIEQKSQVEIFSPTSEGIQSSWSEILGFYYDDV